MSKEPSASNSPQLDPVLNEFEEIVAYTSREENGEKAHIQFYNADKEKTGSLSIDGPSNTRIDLGYGQEPIFIGIDDAKRAPFFARVIAEKGKITSLAAIQFGAMLAEQYPYQYAAITTEQINQGHMISQEESDAAAVKYAAMADDKGKKRGTLIEVMPNNNKRWPVLGALGKTVAYWVSNVTLKGNDGIVLPGVTAFFSTDNKFLGYAFARPSIPPPGIPNPPPILCIGLPHGGIATLPIYYGTRNLLPNIAQILGEKDGINLNGVANALALAHTDPVKYHAATSAELNNAAFGMKSTLHTVKISDERRSKAQEFLSRN